MAEILVKNGRETQGISPLKKRLGIFAIAVQLIIETKIIKLLL